MRVLSVDRAITADSELDACLKSGRPPKRHHGGNALRLALSVGAGWLLFLSFPPRTLWFLAPVAIALLTAVLQGRSLRAGFGFGYAAGLGFFVPLLPWVGAYVGATPWLALAAIEALAFGVFGVLAVAVGHAPPLSPPVWIAGAWVTAEALRSRIPFGGFPWGAFGLRAGRRPAAAVGFDRRGARSFLRDCTDRNTHRLVTGRTLPCSMASIGERWRLHRPHLCECIGDKFSRCRP